jgi:hypothetical protein
MNPIARLRIVQVGGILLVLACICISRLGHHERQGTLAPRHWIVMAGVIWSAISGFTLQRRIVSRPVNSRRPSASTPFTRGRAGAIFRRWTAMTVGNGGAPSQRVRWAADDGEYFLCALPDSSVGVDAGHCSRPNGVNVGNSVETPHDCLAGLASCDPTICHLPSRFITTSIYP